jgi:hypothetical protein
MSRTYISAILQLNMCMENGLKAAKNAAQAKR